MLLTVKEEICDKRRHQTALGVMDIVPVPEPILGLKAWPFLATGPPLRYQMGSKVLGKILGDQTRLCENDGLTASCFNAYNGSFAERMDLLELGISSPFIPLVDLDFVVNIALFEKPDNSLGTRFF